jgi:hypothetical protein
MQSQGLNLKKKVTNFYSFAGMDNFSDNQKNFIWIYLNGYPAAFEKEISIIQATYRQGWYVPRFCYHSRLKIAGNCRMCFVEIEGITKPVIACATLIKDGLKVYLNSLLVYKSRESVLEFLLINHPLDCPICDQGGECDLQDQFLVMGSLTSRYYEENKKTVFDKNLSFLIKLSLNKCINCSRCVRFANDIVGDYSFSLIGRGENLEISNYAEDFFFSEISGNIVDLCPVGALTLKPLSYKLRPWETVDVKYVDFFDVFQPPIRIDFRGLSIIRVLPLQNNDIQEEWIGDKIRFIFTIFNKNRIFKPYLKINNNFFSISWISALIFIKNYYFKIINFFTIKKLFFYNLLNFDDNFSDVFQVFLFKKIFKKISFFNLPKYKKNNIFRKNYFLAVKDWDFLEYDIFFLINLNLRNEFPLLNLKIKEKISYDYIKVFFFGPFCDFNFFYFHCGNNLVNLWKLLNFNFKKNEKIGYFFGKINSNFINYLNFFKKTNSSFYFLNNSTNLCILDNEINLFNQYKSEFLLNNFYNYFSTSINFNQTFFLNKNFFINKKVLNTKFSHFDSSENTFNNLFLPLRYNFEQPSVFLNIIGVYTNLSYSSYRIFLNSVYSDLQICKSLVDILNLNLKLNLNSILRKKIPYNWEYEKYYLKLFQYELEKNNFFVLILYNFFFFKLVNYYTNFVNLNDYYKKICKKFFYNLSIFKIFIKVNSYQWLF